MDFVVSLILTALVYTGPFILFRYAIYRAAIGKNIAIISVVAYSIVLSLVLYLLYPYFGLEPKISYGPAVIWGIVSVMFLTKGAPKIAPAKAATDPGVLVPTVEAPATETPTADLEKPKGKAMPSRTINIAGVVIILLLLAANIYQFGAYRSETSELKDLLVDKTHELSELKIHTDLEAVALQGRADFMDEFVVIVPDDDSGLYHRYGCEDLNLLTYRFWVYNPEAVESFGYDPCPKCI